MVELQNCKYSKFTSNVIALLILLTKHTNILLVPNCRGGSNARSGLCKFLKGVGRF